MRGISQTIDEWRPTAVAWARQQVADDATAEDIAQEAMLRLATHYNKLDPDRSVAPWLQRVVCNCAHDCRRAQNRALPKGTAPMVGEGAVDKMVDIRRLWQSVEEEVSRLPHSQRQALAEQLNGQETMSGTTRVSSFKARRALKDKFGHRAEAILGDYKEPLIWATIIAVLVALLALALPWAGLTHWNRAQEPELQLVPLMPLPSDMLLIPAPDETQEPELVPVAPIPLADPIPPDHFALIARVKHLDEESLAKFGAQVKTIDEDVVSFQGSQTMQGDVYGDYEVCVAFSTHPPNRDSLHRALQLSDLELIETETLDRCYPVSSSDQVTLRFEFPRRVSNHKLFQAGGEISGAFSTFQMSHVFQDCDIIETNSVSCSPKRGRSKSFSEGFNEPPSMPKIGAIFRKHKLPEPIVSELPETTYEGRLHTWLEPPRD